MQANTPRSANPANSPAGDSHFPRITSKDLAGRSITLPSELPGERTLLLIAFAREQQHDIDGWVAGLHLDNGKLPWLEVPVIDNPGVIGRWFIDNGMRRGIENHDTWKHVVTLYTGKAEVKAALGIATESTIYAMVVDRQGKIILSVPGSFTAHGAALLQAALLSEAGSGSPR